MRDPYLYDGETILINKLDIHDQNMLNDAEADFVTYRLKDLSLNPLRGNYDVEHSVKESRGKP